MEAENGSGVETDKHVVMEKVQVDLLNVDVKKREENVCENGQFNGDDGVHESVKQDNGVLNVCGPEEGGEVCGTLKKKKNKNKSLTENKPNHGGVLKKNNTRVNKDNNKSTTSSSVKASTASAPRGIVRPPILSQSLSFPAKGLSPEAMRKSIDVYPVKSNGRQTRKIGVVKDEASVLKEKLSSARSVAKSKSFASQKSGESLSANGTSNGVADEGPIDQDSKPKSTLPRREDEDARSTTSSAAAHGMQRNSVPGFSSRLQERAEKRKEFYSKLEEKIHAREVERNNLQAKSKENQEAEIKQFRKSLTFKATPMPSFYKEPPPKVDLKKIPTTRPISPKLGRNKTSSSTSNNSSESGGSCLSPRAIKLQGKSPAPPQANGNKNNTTLKKPGKAAQPKPPSQDLPKTTKTKVKPAAEGTCQDANTGAEKVIEVSHQSTINPRVEEQMMTQSTEENCDHENAETLDQPIPEMFPAEVTVEN